MEFLNKNAALSVAGHTAGLGESEGSRDSSLRRKT